MTTLNRLHMSWRHGDLSLKHKIIIYNAIIRTKLIYGLESVAPNAITIRKVNAFHMNGLRKILNVPLLTSLKTECTQTNTYLS